MSKNKIDLLLEIVEFRFNYIENKEDPSRNKSFVKLKMFQSGIITFLLSLKQVNSLRQYVYNQNTSQNNVFCLFDSNKYITCKYSFEELSNEYWKGVPVFFKNDNKISQYNQVLLTCNNPEVLNKSFANNGVDYILKNKIGKKDVESVINFTTKTKPYSFQEKCSKLGILNNKYGYFLDVGLGKTKVSIDTAINLFKTNNIKNILILSPAYLITNWLSQLKEHSNYDDFKDKIILDSHSSLSTLNGTVKRYNLLLDTKKSIEDKISEISIINTATKSNTIFNCDNQLKHYQYSLLNDINKSIEEINIPKIMLLKDSILNGETLVIIDECHNFKESTSNRTKRLLSIMFEVSNEEQDIDNVRILILTGTPNPKGYIDLFIYGKIFDLFINPDYTKDDFIKDFFFYKIVNTANFKKSNESEDNKSSSAKYSKDIIVPVAPKINLLNEYIKRLQEFSIWIDADEVLELPEKIYTPIYCPLNETQKQMIEKVLQESSIDITDPVALSVLSENDNPHMTVIQQIQGGFMYNDEPHIKGKQRSATTIENNPRLEVLAGLVKSILDTGDNVIIFTIFNEEVKIIGDYLNKNIKNIKLRTRCGYNNNNENEAARILFEKGEIEVLVGTDASTGTGFTLTKGNHIIYYSSKFNAEMRIQTEGRIRRIGQNKKCYYYDILSENGIDKIVYNVLMKKLKNIKEIKTEHSKHRTIELTK